MQLEFVMLDPYIRKTLTYKENGQYSTVVLGYVFYCRLFVLRMCTVFTSSVCSINVRACH